MRSTFRILFYVNKQRAKDGCVPIYVRLTVNGKSTFVSSRLNIPLPLWDSAANKAAGKSIEAKRINVELDRIKAKLLHHYLHISDRDAYVTAERYEGQKLVSVAPFGGTAPRLSANALAGSDRLEITVCGHEEQTMLTARFDNLGKGASGAAVQNMNLMLGFDETAGLAVE